MDLIFPPYLYPDDESVEVVDRTSTVFRPEFAPGVVQRQEQDAPKLRVTQKYSGMSALERGALLAFVRQTRGRVNGIWLTPLRYSPRGSFPAAELLTNTTFANGTTGWSATGAGVGTISVADRVLRVPHAANGVAGALSSTVTVVPYAPYVGRTFFKVGKYAATPTLRSYFDDVSSIFTLVATATGGLLVGSFVPATTTARAVPQDDDAGTIAGDYFEIPYVSLSRCALVDDGSNLLPRSDEFDNAAWAKNELTVVANVATAPDGTATADRLVETAATAAHWVSQAVVVSATTLDYSLTVPLIAGSRGWAWISLSEATGGTSVVVFINLSTGAVGTSSTGANWSNLRTAVVNLGGGWYALTLTARKTNAATSITAGIGAATADNTSSYAGTNGLAAIYTWRATLAQSSVPTRLRTTTTVSTNGDSQTGSNLYLKGLPASTNGLLVPGDLFQIGSELKQVTAALDSDAAGLGYLQFEPPLFRVPADNAPVIIHQPFGKFILADNSKIMNRLGRYADVNLAFEELYE